MMAGKQRERREETGSQYPLQGHASSDLTSSHYTPLPKGSPTSQWCLGLGTKPLAYRLWGISDTNYNKGTELSSQKEYMLYGFIYVKF
jgi:hypothetical protein